MGFETLISVGKLFVFHIIIECKWLSHECLINIIVQFHKWIQCPQIIIMDTASFFHVTENIDFSPAIIWINTDSKLVDSHLTKKKKKKGFLQNKGKNEHLLGSNYGPGIELGQWLSTREILPFRGYLQCLETVLAITTGGVLYVSSG